jgi:translation initiation factor IF-2
MSKKVFELAKELDLKPLDLVEELKNKGFNVKNHMATLSDEELSKFMALRTSEISKVEEAKKAKTKVATRKKVEKKPAAETKTEGLKSSKKEKPAETPKETTVKKSAIIRRKHGPDKVESEVEHQQPEEDSHLNIEPQEFVQDTHQETIVSSEPEIEETQVAPTPAPTPKGGLRIVAAAPEKKKEPEVKRPEGPAKQELYQEKMHRFTPVYTPPKVEKPAVSPGPQNTEFSPTSKDDKLAVEDANSKKSRLSSLATMVSGKRVGAISRAQVIQETKAEHELKSYSQIAKMGLRPHYVPIGKKKIYLGKKEKTELTEVKESKRVLKIHDGATAEELAEKLSLKFSDLADKVLDINLLLKPSDYLGVKLTEEIAALYNYRVEDVSFKEEEIIESAKVSEKEKEQLPHRDPIITIMGHVDHGKTTLIDYIRSAKVAQGEAGGITQHIGAYSVDVKGKRLTFLDTPGHAAFHSMRQRGADVTDIVVLVVAADDGVMPQTKESIKFCQNAKVPLIVAMNKMDKEGANPDKIKTALTEFHITAEDWGGETPFVPISALKGTGVDALLEAIALQAEIMDLRAPIKGPAKGVVVESKIEQGRGPVATVLVQSGTLEKGDSIVVGECYGSARSLTNYLGEALKSAGPSVPVQILGLNGTPNPGDILNVVKNEREAKKIVDNRINERKELEATPSAKKLSLEDFFGVASKEGAEEKTLNLLVRSDVQGSFEAIKQSLEALSNPEVKVKVIGGGVGPITDSDVLLVDSAKGYIIGFNMRPSTTARKLAEQKGVDIKNYSIIYELIGDIKLAIEGLLEPEFIEEYVGRAEVKDTFQTPKAGTIAGSQVIDGKIVAGCSIRLLRNGKIIFDGKMSSLRRFKDDVKEVRGGLECGIALEKFNDIKVGDLFEAYIIKERKRTLEEVQAQAPTP